MDSRPNDHQRLDERSLALHRLIAQRLRADPAVLDRARANLQRWQKRHGDAGTALREWEHVLTTGVDQVPALLVENSERAARLRQSSPFTGILKQADRMAVYESYATRTYHQGGQRDLG